MALLSFFLITILQLMLFCATKCIQLGVFLVWVLTYFVPFVPSVRCTLLFLLSFTNSASTVLEA